VVADVDEDAEVGVAVDRPPVVPTGGQLVRLRPAELEDDVFLVHLADAALHRRAADDTRTHYLSEAARA